MRAPKITHSLTTGKLIEMDGDYKNVCVKYAVRLLEVNFIKWLVGLNCLSGAMYINTCRHKNELLQCNITNHTILLSAA